MSFLSGGYVSKNNISNLRAKPSVSGLFVLQVALLNIIFFSSIIKVSDFS
jgi:triosephosphate isomerase